MHMLDKQDPVHNRQLAIIYATTKHSIVNFSQTICSIILHTKGLACRIVPGFYIESHIDLQPPKRLPNFYLVYQQTIKLCMHTVCCVNWPYYRLIKTFPFLLYNVMLLRCVKILMDFVYQMIGSYRVYPLGQHLLILCFLSPGENLASENIIVNIILLIHYFDLQKYKQCKSALMLSFWPLYRLLSFFFALSAHRKVNQVN